MDSKLSRIGRWKVFLELGRVSNLPTIWSNCLAAWLLGGAGDWGRFAPLCAGATLLYTGGMFLNDACDIRFDRQHRPERPIPSGRISAGAVWLCGGACLVLGWLAILPLGKAAAGFASLLLVSILLYDAVHKRTKLAPLLMAGCRFLVYLVAGAAAERGADAGIVWRALALAGYITGLSCLARGESVRGPVARWPAGLLFAPIAIAVFATAWKGRAVWALTAGLAIWVSSCLWGGRARAGRRLSGGVAGLLAGIVLVDWLAAAEQAQGWGAMFGGLFLLALLLQRIAPAT